MPDPSLPSDLLARCTFRGETLPDPLSIEPMSLVTQWLGDALAAKSQPNPGAMTLATADASGQPSARIVLCRGMDAARGYLVFYTNYDSAKGTALESNPRAAAVFHWDHLDRQIRIQGPVTHSPAAESDAYFNQRTLGSRIGAWASHQSAPLADRGDLLSAASDTMQRFGISFDTDLEHDRTTRIPRPPNWGGYRLWAQRVELWLGHSGRLHDRAQWTRTLSPATTNGVDGFTGGAWSATRLQP